jgi:hypothetical protein
MDELLEAQELRVEDRTAWSKCTHALECFFTAFSPLATNILTIANEAQSVSALLSFSHAIDRRSKPLWIACQRAASGP